MTRRRPDAATLLAIATVALVALPIVVATARGLHHGWLPIGDNAFFEVRARDVFTRHHPLVGTWTSASTSVGVDINNPGPLFFDLLALPTKLLGSDGLAVGVAAMNVASVVGIAVLAWRRGGPVTTAASMAMAGGLVWAMGSELLYDTWQPNSLLLPFLLLLTMAWSVMAGDVAVLPWLVGLASFLVQTHFSYALLVALLGGAAVLVVVVEAVRGKDVRRRTLRLAAISAVVALVAWSQPLIDQVDGDGFGNLAKLLANAGRSPKTIGTDLGARLVASILALPPFFGRPSIEKGLVLLGPSRLPTTAVAVAALAVVGIGLAVLLAVATKRAERPVVAALALALLALGGALLTASVIPLGIFAVAPHQLRWLWPIGTFLAFALLLFVARTVLARVPVTTRVAGLGALVLVAALLALPTYNPRTGPTADAESIPTARRLIAQLGPLEGKGPLLLDTRGIRFAEPYNLAVMADLQRRGIEFRVDEPVMIHQLGPSRAADGTERGRLLQRDRDEAFVTPPGATLIARVEGLTPAGRAELRRLRDEVAAYVESEGLRLNAKGRAALAIDALHDFPASGELHAAEPFIRGDDFVLLVRKDLAPLDPAMRPKIERYVDLLEQWQKHTVAIFLEPAA